MSGSFVRSEVSGSATSLHGRPIEDEDVPAWTRLKVNNDAIVLGSTQPIDVVDVDAAANAGIEVVRRRSGGGAVWLDSETHWVDVTIGVDDGRWSNDVGRAFLWLGVRCVEALASMGVEAQMHAGPLIDFGWSRLVCFGGLGSGEVTVDGKKLIGMSQRRTRTRARFQIVMYQRWNPQPMVGILRASDPTGLSEAAGGFGVGADEVAIDAEALWRNVLAAS